MPLPTSPRRKLLQLRTEQLRRATGRDFPLAAWAATRRVQLKPGVKFDLNAHYYLAGLYTCTRREMVVFKASQVGASELLISYALHAADARRATVLYLFPTDGDISDFSTARFGPAIEASPYLSNITGRQVGVRGADRVKLKRVGDRFLYLRGAHVNKNGNAPQLLSVDADVLILDEVDAMDRRALPIARHRIDHSELKEIRYVSTPTYAGIGIHRLWKTSDQRSWFVRCEHCGNRQDMVIDDIVTQRDALDRPSAWHGQTEDRAWVACRSCGRELDRLQRGEWVAKFPERERAGFHLTKLFSPLTELVDVVKSLQTVDETEKKEAFNQHLGLPYSPRGGRLTREELDAARRDYAHGIPGSATIAGIDVGAVLHVVIRERRKRENGERRQVWAGMSTWADLQALLKRYRVRTAVIDALPETTMARKFQASYRGTVWLAYYVAPTVGIKKPAAVQVNKDDGIVNCDRTRTLDAMYAGLRDGGLTLPGHARAIPDYYDHLYAPARRVVQTARGTVVRYIEDAADHLAHGENYCEIAAGMGAASLPQNKQTKESQWT